MTTTPPPPNDPEQSGPGGYPTYPGEGGSYPAYPETGGAPPAGPGPDVPQPSSIRTAVRLMLVGAAVSLVSVVVSLATLGTLKDDIRDELVKDDPNVSQSTIDGAYTVAIGFVVVLGAVGVLLWLWMAWKNGQGRSWARVVATVLGALNVLFTLMSFTSANAEPIVLVFSAINLILSVVILVLLWRKDSSDFYIASSRPQLS